MVLGLHTPLLGRPAIESLGLITLVASIGLTGDQIPLPCSRDWGSWRENTQFGSEKELAPLL